MDIVQITDLHITKDINQEKNNCVPYSRLYNTLETVKLNHKNIEYLIITGDLSNDYSLESYQHIKDLLKKYTFKISLLPGNHDDFTLIKSLEDDQISTGNLDLSNANGLAYNFDTHVPGMISGKLKKSQIHDLIKNLDIVERVKNVLIFTHHPLKPIGSKWIDKHICENSELLINTLQSYENLRFSIFSGHVHQEFHLKIGNIKFFTTPSTCYQFEALSDDFKVDENLSYGYRVITLHDKTISTKVHRVLT